MPPVLSRRRAMRVLLKGRLKAKQGLALATRKGMKVVSTTNHRVGERKDERRKLSEEQRPDEGEKEGERLIQISRVLLKAVSPNLVGRWTRLARKKEVEQRRTS